jgi:hypothetical protein
MPIDNHTNVSRQLTAHLRMCMCANLRTQSAPYPVRGAPKQRRVRFRPHRVRGRPTRDRAPDAPSPACYVGDHTANEPVPMRVVAPSTVSATHTVSLPKSSTAA